MKEFPSVYVLVPELHRHEKATRIRWKDSAGILASMLKLVEVFILWKDKAYMLSMISLCSWAYYFCVSIVLEMAGLSREISKRASECELDILAGQMPTTLKAGGQCKLLLGAPHNVRNGKLWQTAWVLGSLVSTASVIATYMTLSSQDSMVFVEWTGFQFLWLGLRSAFYHFADNTDRLFQHPILLKKDWKNLSRPLKARVRGIVQALSLYQMHVHPRELYSYEEDDRIIRETYILRLSLPLPAQHISDVTSSTIFISAVIGDTLLSSASFITGRKFAPLDQYDTCVVIFRIGKDDIAIPAARVVSGTPPVSKVDDVEAGFELALPPKGSANRGKFDLTWWYWIPYGEDMWLELHTTDMCILGERHATIRTDAAITELLSSGKLHVSISEVSHIKEIVMNSRLGFEALQSLLK